MRPRKALHPPFLLVLWLKVVICLAAAAAAAAAAARASPEFSFNGFKEGDLVLSGSAFINSSGFVYLTEATNQVLGHAFFPSPFPFINRSTGKPSSFSTSFVFAIASHFAGISSEGLAFVISPAPNFLSAFPSQFLGLFNLTSNGNPSSHIVAVELDTIKNTEFGDINDNHIGIDVNGLISADAAPASYRFNSSSFRNLSLISGKPMRVWAEYDAEATRFNVTLAPLASPKPASPLLSTSINLSSVFLDEMYVGFSASTGAAAGVHYILGWSFSLNGRAKDIQVSLPPPAASGQQSEFRRGPRAILFWLPVGAALFLLLGIGAPLLFLLSNRRKFAEVSEDWEKEYFPQRFLYRDLHRATGGFRLENLLGNGGFGDVYKGTLHKTKQEIAVKRISHDSRQGMKEFVAEIASIGRLRHRNLVQLLGYTRRKKCLILVYEFMPNGSLDRYLFGRAEQVLGWKERFRIIKGIAAGLLYLHEEWEQIVLHRDIKAGNVLLDADFNGKLGDFGLARLHDRGAMAETTRVVGTLGYLAPEIARTGKSTTSSDVYAFGAFLLEVACGKKPVELKTTGVELVLVDWVLDLMLAGELIEARDRRMGDDFVEEEVKLVLSLGLLCSSPAADVRPTIRQVVQYLEGELSMPRMTDHQLELIRSGSTKPFKRTLVSTVDSPPAQWGTLRSHLRSNLRLSLAR